MDYLGSSENKRFDFNFALIILALNVVGLINLYSASGGVNAVGISRLFWQQMVWLSMGWAIYLIVTFLNYNIVKMWATQIYVVNLLFLVAVIFVGKKSLGAQRWVDLGFFRFQPSETMKVALVLVIAKILAHRIRQEGMGLKDLITPLAITIVPFVITVVQPDLGTSLLYLAVIGTTMLFVKIKRSIIAVALISVAIALPVVWQFGLKDYQKGRVLTFLSPGRDPRGAGYNSIQSKIAVGSGQIFGKGFKKGTQSQLEFLPERHTDFIFSVLSEEHGFVGSLTTIALFGVLFVLGLRIAQNTKDPYACIVVIGLMSIIFWHFFINIGMVMGILPIVGVPLPLISYGGSSLLTTMASLGIISSISYNRSLFQS
jgi:rod shape determining protein RodA